MNKVRWFFNNFPAKFPSTCGFVLLCMLLATIDWLLLLLLTGANDNPTGSAGGMGGALLFHLTSTALSKFALVGTSIIFVAELLNHGSSPSSTIKHQFFSHFVWALFGILLFPVIHVYDFIAFTHPTTSPVIEKITKQVKEAPYLIASPQAKLKHELDTFQIKMFGSICNRVPILTQPTKVRPHY